MAAGFRSLAAPWAGGVAAPARRGGYRSLVAFWLGGACAPVSTPPVPPVDHGGGSGFIRIPMRRRKLDEEEDLMAIILAALVVLNGPYQ